MSALTFYNSSVYTIERPSAFGHPDYRPSRHEGLTIQQVYEITNWGDAVFIVIAQMDIGDNLTRRGIFVERTA